MKKIKYLLAVALVMLLCTSAQAQKKYSFTGKLNNKISFRLDLEQNRDSIIAGETTYYRKNGKTAKIPVYGWCKSPAEHQLTWDGNMLILTEFDGTKQCGYFWVLLSKDDKIVDGGWSYTEKEYAMDDIKQATFPQGKTFFHPAKGAAVNGDYSYYYTRESGLEDRGGSCTLTYKNGKVNYSFSKVDPNIAEEENTAVLKGSYFTGSNDANEYKCYVDRNFLYIWTTNDGDSNNWGAYTRLDGFYIKK